MGGAVAVSELANSTDSDSRDIIPHKKTIKFVSGIAADEGFGDNQRPAWENPVPK